MNLNRNEKGVSPVIGVILMVAITVILAAVIATFALSFTESTSESVPNANFDAELVNEEVSEGDTILQFTHQGGNAVDADAVGVSAPAGEDDGISVSTNTSDDRITAGDTITVDLEDAGDITDGGTLYEAGERFQLTYEVEGDSAILRSYVLPEDVTYDDPGA